MTVAARRLAPDVRRTQILDAAVEVFGSTPYAEVSTAAVAREAGVARGLLHHYFGTKRELYLAVVRRLVLLDLDPVATTGSLKVRVDRSVAWYLDAVSAHGATFVRVVGAEGVAADPEVSSILAAADDAAARAVLRTLGLPDSDPRQRAAVRAYGGLAKAAVREWLEAGTLDREDVHLLLAQALVAVVRDVLPGVAS